MSFAEPPVISRSVVPVPLNVNAPVNADASIVSTVLAPSVTTKVNALSPEILIVSCELFAIVTVLDDCAELIFNVSTPLTVNVPPVAPLRFNVCESAALTMVAAV